MPTVITANRLLDGIVVFLGPEDRWVEQLRDALVVSDGEAALARAKQDEARQIVVEPYAIDVVQSADSIAPRALREAIRANGPTVRADLGKTPHRK